MKVAYKIKVKDIDTALNIIDNMNDRVSKFIDKFPEYNYSESIEEEDGSFIVIISINDGKDDENEVFKEFTDITETS